MLEKIKFKIAQWIDKKYPQSCWANLVSWSKGDYTFKEMFNKDDGIWKTQDCEHQPYNYCGKCDNIKKKSYNSQNA